MVSRFTRGLLEKTKVKCLQCPEVVPYVKADHHELTHHLCKFCNKSLPNWSTLRQHYYNFEGCQEVPIDCLTCDFVFKRKNYKTHNCDAHLRLRSYEGALFALFYIVYAFSVGLTRQLNLNTCDSYLAEFRSGLASFGWNNCFAFWNVVMAINLWTMKRKQSESLIYGYKLEYVVGLFCGSFLITLNFLTNKYNSALCNSPYNTQWLTDLKDSGAQTAFTSAHAFFSL